MQKFRLAAQGYGPNQPPEAQRQRVLDSFDPLPIWYMPHEESMVDTTEYPLHALTQRPMIMYHSWGSQNAWLRQILGRNKLYVATSKAKEMGLVEGDWVRVTSHNGTIKVQIKLLEGLNPDTVWTWNAIGKRSGSWALSEDAPESKKGFLLNHLISDLLPKGADKRRVSNSDPVTGQAAWFDLRVRIEKCAPGEAEISEPQFPPLPKPPGVTEGQNINRFGEKKKK